MDNLTKFLIRLAVCQGIAALSVCGMLLGFYYLDTDRVEALTLTALAGWCVASYYYFFGRLNRTCRN